METFIDLLASNARNIVIPLAIFIFSLIGLLWLRQLALNRLSRWVKEVKWAADIVIYHPMKRLSFILCLILSASLGLSASIISDDWKRIIEHSLWTLFVFIFVLAVLNLLNGLILFFEKHLSNYSHITKIHTIISVIAIGISVLVVLGIWGVPTGPLLLVIAIAAVLMLLALRDAAPNFFAGFQLFAWKHIAVGDSIKLENGEEGCVIKIGLSNIQMQTLEGDKLIIPNSQLVKQRIIKMEHRSKKIKQIDTLTQRELEIARLISEGTTNKGIANKLFITENTAKVHVKNILKKLGLKNRQQLAVYTALKDGSKADTNSTK
jgi:DNA-binding CsgD family transcriptional regulator